MAYPNYARIRYLPNRSMERIRRGEPIAVIEPETRTSKKKSRRGAASTAGRGRAGKSRKGTKKRTASKTSGTKKRATKTTARSKPRRVSATKRAIARSKAAQRIWGKTMPLSAFSKKAARELQAAHDRIIAHRGRTKKGRPKPVSIALARLALEPEVVSDKHDLRGTQKLRTHRRVRDVVFTMDARKAIKRAGIPLEGIRKGDTPIYQDIRRMVRHPQHLSKRAYPPWTGREWKEFSGLRPSVVSEFSGTALHGSFPGVRLETLEGTTADSRRRVVIDATSKPLYLVWSNGGRRFALAGSRAAIKELAQDFSRVNEPIRLRVVNYFAPRYPVPRGMRRTYANTRKGEIGEMGIAFTHKVENETYLLWNGETDPSKALFWLQIKGKTRRHVSRSGLTF